MAANEIKVGINVSDNGTTNKAIKSAKDLKNAYDAAAKSAAAVGGTQGSRAAMAASARDYTVSRGAASATGASARDFANQAQGLSGLVRLYATYAANVFAVGAAFRALREAAATENITRGLENMGASGGRALVALSKNISSITGGALSIREAMSSVAKSSAAGLSNKQIQDLATVAAKASNALGVNMEDALSRVTRGVTKLEPELLDELGLFTKIGGAVEAYALKVGKSVTALSDFERRQAFANAVTQEGLDKYKDIEALANPYDKLNASVSNLATKGLGLVNSALSPLVNLLAESPGALAGVFTLLGMNIIKSAIPAIGQMRLGLKYAAQDSVKAAESFKNSFGDRFQDLLEKRFNLESLRKKSDEALSQISLNAKQKSIIATALSGEEEAVGAMKRVEAMISRRTREIEKLKDATDQETISKVASKKAEVEALKVIRERGQAELQAQTLANKKQGYFDSERIVREAYDKMVLKGLKDTLIARASENAQVIGFTNSMRLLHQEVAEMGLTKWSKWSTLVTGSIAAATSRVAQLIGRLGTVGAVIGILVGSYQLLDSILSKATKQQEEFNRSLDASEEVTKTAKKTLELYSEKRKDAFSTEATIAFSKSIDGIADSLWDSTKAIQDWQKNANWWDQLTDNIAGIFGRSNQQKLTKNLQEGISASLSNIEISTTNAASAVKPLATALGITTEDVLNKTNNYKEAINRIAQEGPAGLFKITGALKQVSDAQSSASNSLIAFNESLKEIDKNLTEIVNAAQLNSIEGKLGSTLVAASLKFADALKNPIQNLQTLEKIANDPKLQALFGTQAIKAPEVTTKQLGELDATIKRLKTEKAAFDIVEVESQRSIAAGTKNTSEMVQKYDSIVSKLKDASLKFEDLRKKAVDYAKEQFQFVAKLAEKGLEYTKLATKLAKEQAGLTIKSAQVGIAGKAGGYTAELEREIALKQINIQERIATNGLTLEKAILDNTRAIQDNTAIQQYLQALKDVNDPDEAVRSAAGILVETLKPAYALAIRAKNNVKLNSLLDRNMSAEDISATNRLASGRLAEDRAFRERAEGARAESEASKRVVELNYQSQLAEEQNTRIQRSIQLELQRLDIANSYLDTQTQVGIAEQVIESKAKNKLEYDSQISEINKELRQLEIGNSADTLRKAELEAKKTSVERLKESRDFLTDINAKQTINKLISEDISKIYSEQEKLLDISTKEQEAAISVREQALNIQQDLGILTAEQSALEKASIEKTSQALKFKQEIIKQDNAIALQTLAVSQNKLLFEDIAAKLAKETDETAKDALRTKLIGIAKEISLGEENTAVLLKSRNITESTNTSFIDRINKQTELNVLTAKWSDTLNRSTELANNLAGAFGAVGEAIGGSITAMLELAKAQETYTAAKKAAGDDPKAQAEAEKNLQNAQLSGLTKIVSANKKMFDEKSKGYQLMTTLEKGLTAVQAINNALRLKDTIASAYAAVTAMAPAIMAQFLKWLGPWGFAAGALAIAAIGGRAPSTPGFSMSSQQLQETQGTGSTYVGNEDGTGRLVATGGGVFGDLKAKSESIDNTLKLMKENQATGIVQNDRLYNAFKKLDDSILAVAGALPNFQTSLFGTSTGTVKDTVLGGLLSSSTVNTEIVSSGLYLQGSFLDLSKSVEGLASIFEKIKTTTEDSYLFGLISGGTDVSFDTNTAELSNNQKNLLKDMFSVGVDALAEVAGEVGIGRKVVEGVLDAIEMTPIDLQGLSLEDQASAIKSVIGSKLADATTAIFGSNFINAYRKAGEDALDTVVRVLDQNDKISQMVVNLQTRYDETGKKIPPVTKSLEGLYDVTDQLAKNAGDLNNFVDQYQYFIDNFFTSEEKLALSTKSVTAELSKLGLSQIKTKAQFKSYVQALDLTIPAQQALYQGLMDLAPAFNEVASETEKALESLKSKFEKFTESLIDYKDSLLLGSSSTLTPLQKYEESRRQFENTYLKALSGDDKAMSDLTSAADSFLDASKTYNASSSQYTQDFNSVLDKVNNAISYSENQVTTAEQQLTELETQTSILSGIEKAVVTTANLLTSASGGTEMLSTTETSSSSSESPGSLTASVSSSLGYSSSSYTGSELTADQIAFFDFLDSDAGKIFKDLRGESLSNAIATGTRGIFSILGGTGLGLAVGAAQYATGAINENALSVFEADALATAAMNDPVLLQTITDAVAAGVTIESIKETLRDAMSAEASTTSFIGDLFKTGSGNLDAAAKAVTTATGIIADAAETSKAFDQALSDASSTVSEVYSFSTTPATSSGSSVEGNMTLTGTTADGDSYTATWNPSWSFAKGGYASGGVALVGENGPELVDFQSPGRVYTAEETFGMFNGTSSANQELIDEIKNLRKEVQELRKQQQEETGVLVSATFDSQKNASKELSETIKSTSSTSTWSTKLQNSVALV